MLLVFPVLLLASDISGTVKNSLDKTPLNDAIIKLIKIPENKIVQTVITENNGNYFISNVTSGVYQIEVSKPGFYKNILFDFKVEPLRNYDCNIYLLQKSNWRRGQGKRKNRREKSNDGSDYCFMIGSIEVKSHGEELIPEEAVTTRKISSGEIEHMQAASLGDVLNLIPGIEKTQNPGLSKQSKVGIRSVSLDGIDGALESFGTTIIVDNNEMSSAADADPSGRSGLDLRTIPADNIESVEVISGIPSAEYGNFSNGIIKVKTKSGYVQNKMKAKLNPDTKTTSYSGGYKLSNSSIDYHFNYGFSERDLREDGDEYHRLYGKLGYSKPFFNEKLKTRSNFTFTKILDSDAPVGIYKIRDYNEGYKTSGSFSFDYEKSENQHFKGFFNINLNRKKDFKERYLVEQVTIDSNTVVNYEGIELSDTTLVGYIGKKQIKGYGVSVNSNLKYNQIFSFGNHDHDFLFGINNKFESNIGNGLVLDHFWNYYGVYSTQRSYAYDEYDPMNQYSFFIQDKIRGKLFSRKYNLMIGLRYTAFNPKGIDFSKGFLDTQNGEFFCPRFNLQYFISDGLRFRIGAGTSAKAVSLAYLYKAPAYFKYTLNDSVVEEMQLQQNQDLQGYATTKYEASIDWSPNKIIGFSLTGYYTNSDNSPSSRTYPFGYTEKPDTINAARYSIYENLGWRHSYGIEYMIRTKRIRNLQFKMNITYRYSASGRKGTTYTDRADLDLGETNWYKPYSKWREKVIIDYQLNYISQRLGAWVTLEIQHIPFEHNKTEYHSVEYQREINGTDYTFHQGMSNWYDNELYDYGGRWMFNLRITKSLSRKTEFSLYINNLFDDRALWTNSFVAINRELNPEIYYGLEISSQW